MRKKHKHYNLIRAWAEGYTISVKLSYNKTYVIIKDIEWFDYLSYRIEDEYTPLREALKEGKTIQMNFNGQGWKDMFFNKDLIDIAFTSLSGEIQPGTTLRIKPECGFIPYNNIKDCYDLLGKTIVSKDSIGIITGIFEGVDKDNKPTLYFYTGDSSTSCSSSELLKIFTFRDGSPCGLMNK